MSRRNYERPVTVPCMDPYHLVILAFVPDEYLQRRLAGAPRALAESVMRSHWNLRAWAIRQDHLDMPTYPTTDPAEVVVDEPVTGRDWITTTEAARIMGVRTRTVTNAAVRGEVEAQQQAEGTAWQIDRASAIQWREARRRRESRAA